MAGPKADLSAIFAGLDRLDQPRSVLPALLAVPMETGVSLPSGSKGVPQQLLAKEHNVFTTNRDGLGTLTEYIIDKDTMQPTQKLVHTFHDGPILDCALGSAQVLLCLIVRSLRSVRRSALIGC